MSGAESATPEKASAAETAVLPLSVTQLVEFSARSGDLFSDAPAGPTALAGLRGHQTLQARRKQGWQSETRLQAELQERGRRVCLSGRADLLKRDCSPVIVEEIKTTLVAVQYLPENRQQLHWAQARVYGWLVAELMRQSGQSCDLVEVRVSWFDLSCDRVSSDSRRFSHAELEEFTRQLLARYLAWYESVEAHRSEMRSGAQRLAFPHPRYRPQQLQAARYVYRCVREAQPLLLQAPTGSGKTLSVLYPAVKALGQGLVEQVVYVTARGSCQQTALTAAQQLYAGGWRGSVLVLQARDKSCPCRAGASAGELLRDADGICTRTRGFFERLPGARLDCLRSAQLGPRQLAEIAMRHRLCPFALGLEMLPWVDLVICDYNYWFDPLVKLAHFEVDSDSRLLLVDEAHNLPGRARAMYSASLSCADVRYLGRLIRRQFPHAELAPRLVRRLTRALGGLSSLRDESQPPAEKLLGLIQELLLELGRLQADSAGGEQQPQLAGLLPGDSSEEEAADLQELQKKLLRYARIGELFGDAHRHLLQLGRTSGTVELESELLCLDASQYLSTLGQLSRSRIAFSATLRPLEFYADLLAMPQAQQLQLVSSFPEQNQLLLLAGFIDTRWQQRVASVAPLVALIAALASSRPGNYLVFFPSYQYLQLVLEAFKAAHPDVHCVVQSARQGEQARLEFVGAFTEDPAPKIGFAVLGGLYAEAVDFAGDALRGCVVVSPSLAQPDYRQALLQAYYRQRGLDGFAYGSQFPGFTRVQQAAGRVIRSADDRGVVVLVDPRFQQPAYRRLYPAHWQPRNCQNLQQMDELLQDFWAVDRQPVMLP